MIDTVHDKIKDILSKYKEGIAFLDFCTLQSYIDLLFNVAKNYDKEN